MIELTILRELIRNDIYFRKVLPFLKEDYFADRDTKILFTMVSEYLEKYNSMPTRGALEIILDGKKNIEPDTMKQCSNHLETIFDKSIESPDIEWLVEHTEKFCKDKALYNAILESIHIIDGKSKDKDVGSLPKMLSDALAVSFDTHIGHDYTEDADKRYDFYHKVENKIPFNIEQFNIITNGGVPRKTLNILMAGCVHPSTKVKIRYRKHKPTDCGETWIEKEVPISEIDSLLQNGYEVEVDSPDGWVGVNFFIDKGEFVEYRLTTDSHKVVLCNENHLFETPEGWFSASQLTNMGVVEVLTKDGIESAKVEKTNDIIPIVDINVNHRNHRYYTNGVSSHNTGVGKSLFMCHHAAACVMQNLDVLYITCEMAEERIAERIDANLMDIPMEDLHSLPADIYFKKISKIMKTYTGRLIIKEYPTAAANVNHFRALLNELKMKKNFEPDIIFIDYLNICSSSRLKMNASVNSYTFIKAIAEEIRGLAQEFDVPIFSATQTNRSGFSNSDVGLENTSESFGLPATADLFLALIATEELEEQGQIMVKQLKNRYNDISKNKKFVVGIDRSKMKLLDVNSPIVDDRGFVKSEDPVKGKKNNSGVPSANDKYDGWDFN